MLEIFAIAALVVFVVVVGVGLMLLGVAALSFEDGDGHGLHSACSPQPLAQGPNAAEQTEIRNAAG